MSRVAITAVLNVPIGDYFQRPNLFDVNWSHGYAKTKKHLSRVFQELFKNSSFYSIPVMSDNRASYKAHVCKPILYFFLTPMFYINTVLILYANIYPA